MKKHNLLIIICLLSVFFSGCSSCHQNDNIKKPKLNKTQETNIRNVHISIFRYEKTLFSLNVNNLEQGVASLYGKVPENLISKNSWKNPQMMSALKGYLTDPIIKDIYKTAIQQYPNMNDVEQQLNAAFKIYLSHFPASSVPQIYTVVPGLDFSSPSVYGYENYLFINLDMYLGPNFKYYTSAGMPKFISARCDKKYIATDCFTKGIVYKHLPDRTLLTVLDNMIYEGKKIYFTHIMFPDVSEQDLLGYSAEKYQWIVKREADVWQYLVEKNILYSKDDDNIRKFIEETPFTPSFGNDSPGRVGVFIGWKIVKNYMDNHSNTSLDELMQNTDAQQILTDAYYKPVVQKK